MNICITGALGHIGSAFIRNINAKGIDRIYLIDNLLTQRYAALFDLPKSKHFDFHQLDIRSPDITRIIQDSQVVIHLAAITEAETSFYKPKEIVEVNKRGLEHVAMICAKYHCALLFPSTTSVYGVETGIATESGQLRPQSPYAASKLYGERLLSTLGRTKGLRFVILRLGTIVGWSVGMRFHTAVNKFIWQAVTDQDLTVWKTALHQKRPYLDLKDCLTAFNKIVEKDLFNGEIYNLVTANLTVAEIMDMIKLNVPHLKYTLVSSPIMNRLSFAVSRQKSVDSGFVYRGDIQKSIRETIVKLKQASLPRLKKEYE